jgi:hypothetical protein
MTRDSIQEGNNGIHIFIGNDFLKGVESIATMGDGLFSRALFYRTYRHGGTVCLACIPVSLHIHRDVSERHLQKQQGGLK